MKVICAEAMGLCFGVRDALQAAREVLRPAQVTVFGHLVHNPVITRELQDRGFELLDEATRAVNAVQTSAVLITAHGVSNRQRAALEAQGKEIMDTTCPLVRRAHLAALTLARAGYFVVVIGKWNHVEIRGLTGDLDDFAVVESLGEVRRFDAARIGIIAQTTSVEREVRVIVARIRAMNEGAEVRFVNTICRPTRDRQAALEALLEKVDVLVVVGGKHSNNTRQLVARAREAGVRAVHVEGAEEVREEMFTAEEVVGLTAGTSTLGETVERVRRSLEGFYEHFSPLATDRNFSVHVWEGSQGVAWEWARMQRLDYAGRLDELPVSISAVLAMWLGIGSCGLAPVMLLSFGPPCLPKWGLPGSFHDGVVLGLETCPALVACGLSIYSLVDVCRGKSRGLELATIGLVTSLGAIGLLALVSYELANLFSFSL